MPLCFWRKKSSAGKLPSPTRALTACYAAHDETNRWQGDIYPTSTFHSESLPSSSVPFWILLNRTCHMVEEHGRTIKLAFLNYAAVYPLRMLVSAGAKTSLKNQVSEILKGRVENLIFLPAQPEKEIEPLVANFNLIHTVSLENCPRAAQKIAQLSSPFSEHVFQRMSRYFYSVGFDDAEIKSDRNIEFHVQSIKPNQTS